MVITTRALPLAALLLCVLATGCIGPAPIKKPAEPPVKAATTPAPPRDGTPQAIGPVAVIDEVPITAEAFNAEVAFVRASGVAPQVIQQQREQIVDALIQRHLVGLALKRGQVAVTPAELDRVQQTILKQSGQDRAAFDATLKRMGITEADYRARLTERLAMAKLAQAHLRPVTDEDVRAYYDTHQSAFAGAAQVEVQQLLTRVMRDADADAKAAALAKIKALHAQATAPGADFAAIARANNPNTWSLGTFTRDQLIEPIASAVFDLKDNEISAPVQTAAGWHVFRRARTIPATPRPLDAVREEVRLKLATAGNEAALARARQALQTGAAIVRMPQNIR